MILVDTSIIIQLIRGENNEKIALFKEILTSKIPFGISTYTLMEVLQGARNEEDYQKLKEYLNTQKIYQLPEDPKTYNDAARMYFDLRRKGVTPRGTIDVLIARTALFYGLTLLHNDKDYDNMANVCKELKIYRNHPIYQC
jgi:predicted nucleic acid-binding protein